MMRRQLFPIAAIVIGGVAISVTLAQRPFSVRSERIDQSTAHGLNLPQPVLADETVADPFLTPARTRGRKRAVVKIHEVYEPFSPTELKQVQQWGHLVTQIKKTDDEQQRKQLGDQLTELLQKIFDEDLARRDAQLAELEARVLKLRDAVDRRRTHRDRIIGVQVDSVMLDAEGLTILGDQLNPRDPKISDPKASRLAEPVAVEPVLSF